MCSLRREIAIHSMTGGNSKAPPPASSGGEGPAGDEAALLLDRLFTQLEAQAQSGHHEQAAKTAAEILVRLHSALVWHDGQKLSALVALNLPASSGRAQEVAPGDEDATHCLAVAQLHLRHFDKALATLEVREIRPLRPPYMSCDVA